MIILTKLNTGDITYNEITHNITCNDNTLTLNTSDIAYNDNTHNNFTLKDILKTFNTGDITYNWLNL